jgi:hypothetical protein
VTVAPTSTEETPTISDIMEDTVEETQEMDTEEDVLAQTSPHNAPKEIVKFVPNIQWMRDLEKQLPKKRYGIEIRIAPEKTPTEPDKTPQYYHIRIFNAIATSLLTAAPGSAICSIDESEETIVSIDDLPTTQSVVDHYLESPMVNTKTFTYHARIHIMCIKPLFIIMKNVNFMQWL